jgi:maternal embryonic leucine zipper kinase
MIVLVTEYASGGDLFDVVSKKLKLSEMESRKYFRQIVSAVAYLHGSNLAHRGIVAHKFMHRS